jgi:hypothetical protein
MCCSERGLLFLTVEEGDEYELRFPLPAEDAQQATAAVLRILQVHPWKCF